MKTKVTAVVPCYNEERALPHFMPEIQRIAAQLAARQVEVEILLVDEGTSHLDPATAQEIETLIFSIPHLTVIAVSHILHPSTVEMAHKMLHLHGGMLEEEPIP